MNANEFSAEISKSVGFINVKDKNFLYFLENQGRFFYNKVKYSQLYVRNKFINLRLNQTTRCHIFSVHISF